MKLMGKKYFDGSAVPDVADAFEAFLENGDHDLISNFSLRELKAVSKMASHVGNLPWYKAMQERIEEIQKDRQRFFAISFRVLKFVVKYVIPISILLVLFWGKINWKETLKNILDRNGVVSLKGEVK